MAWALALFLACGKENNFTEMEITNTEEKAIHETFFLEKKNSKHILEIPAELKADERAEIYAKLESYVKKYNYDIGAKVSKGSILAILEAPELNAKLLSANSKLTESQHILQTKEDQYKRILQASKTPGAVAESEIIRVKNEMESAKASVNSAKADTINYEQWKSYLVIRAPFSGTITLRNADIGDFVGSKNSQLPLFVLEATNKLRLRVPVPEKYSAYTLKDSLATFSVTSNPGKVYDAKWKRKSGSIDANTRTELWEFEISNPDLKPGMFANVRLDLNSTIPVFQVPPSAIVTNQERKFIIQILGTEYRWIDVQEGNRNPD